MIEKTVRLSCAPTRAFELFTSHATEWWPPSRRHTKDPASEIRMLEGGRFYERASDGTEFELGRVRAWEPPSRVLLDFYPGTDPDHSTEVEITFAAEGESTLVVVRHGPTASSGELFEQRVARFVASWDAVLSALAAASEGAP
jgi:hypothetical protein